MPAHESAMLPPIGEFGSSRSGFSEDLESLLERVWPSLPEEDFRKLKAVVEGLELLTELIASKNTTIRDLPRAAVRAGDGEDARSAPPRHAGNNA